MIVRGWAADVRDLRSAQQAIVPVDLQAFRNLIDSQQEQFLRENLPLAAYRRLQRARYRAVGEYLGHVAANAAVMSRLGEAARGSHDPAIQAQGAELAAAAASLRLHSLLALAQAYTGVLFPGLGLSVGSVADSYDRLTVKVWTIGRSWTPLRSAG